MITAFRLPEYDVFPKIVPAPADRYWMDEVTRGWANRCLPLRIANANGWAVLNTAAVELEWSGKRDLDAVKIRTLDGHTSLARSMFGFGIVTFVIPYLFRTPPGVNMMVRGPVNSPKDGIAPLEGMVETDWLPFTFTMNWQITRPGLKIRFDRDEPFALLTPARRGDTEGFAPVIRNLESEPGLREKYSKWRESRADAQRQKAESNYQASVKQGYYIRGEDHGGVRASEHQTRLSVETFAELEAPRPAEPRQAAAGPAVSAPAPASSPGWWRRITGKD